MSRRPAPRMRLSSRDRAVLGDVGRLRYLSGGQVARLHFNQGTAVGRRRRAQAALRRLTVDGYLHRLPRRIGGVGSGSERFIYQLGYRGQREVFPERRARTPEEIGAVFVEHALAVGEIVVQLVEAERDGLCQALRIETEPAVWRRWVGVGGQAVTLRPDLGVRLRAGDGPGEVELVWFVEVDRATEGLRRVRRKGQRYVDYWRTGLEQERLGSEGVFPRVVWSVPDEGRRDGLERTLRGLPEPASQMFAVALADETTGLLVSGEQQKNENNAKQQKGVRCEAGRR